MVARNGCLPANSYLVSQAKFMIVRNLTVYNQITCAVVYYDFFSWDKCCSWVIWCLYLADT